MCRVTITANTVRIIRCFLSEFDKDYVLQVVFWEVLLNFRERDKYKTNATPIFSPFDDFGMLVRFSVDGRAFNAKLAMKKYIRKEIGINDNKIISKSFRPN